MNPYRFSSTGVADTARLAQALAARAEPGTVVTLEGGLGAGKTNFSSAFGKALGVRKVVNSPTFTLIKEYEGESLPFYHMDVYRISQAEADELGLDDYFYGSGVTLVEWASRIPELLPEERLAITIEVTGETEREFVLEPVGPRFAGWCEQLREEGLLHG